MIAALSTTDLFCLWVVAAALVFDLVVLLRYGWQATISTRVVHWSRLHPSIPFALGFLAGHWFS